MFAAAAAAFVSIFIAEFGDKTQLVSMSLASRYPPLQVLAGAMVALALVLGIAVGAGGIIAALVPEAVIALASGIFFIIIGFYTLVSREKASESESSRASFYQTVGLVFLAEMGDKTQLAAMMLAANFGHPLAVFGGAMAAMFLNHSLAVFLGARFISRLDPGLLKKATAFLFMAIGLAIIILYQLGLG